MHDRTSGTTSILVGPRANPDEPLWSPPEPKFVENRRRGRATILCTDKEQSGASAFKLALVAGGYACDPNLFTLNN